MERAFGWVGKFLRVDLSEGKMEEDDTLRYAPTFIGGRGIATKIGWDEIPSRVGPFDPENPLIFFTGPLTGTNAPFSGRVTISAVSPQTYPTEWFTRSSMGGHWGPELKYAGYDGLVITGRAEEPVYLWLSDGQAQIRSAEGLWGLGTYATQEALMGELGPKIKVVAIGQAGENLSRIAVINSETESAAGQGGFGGVMGSKNLKAIAVRGTGGIAIARPEEFLRQTLAIAKEAHAPHGSPRRRRLRPEAVAKYGQKFQSCSQGCSVRCAQYFRRVPGVVHRDALYSGQLHCVAGRFAGGGRGLRYYDWDIGFEAGFEVSKFANDYGVNHWDFILGIVTFLTGCRESGEMIEIDGIPIDFDDPEFWLTLLRKIAYREGPAGDALAEGGRRAADILDKGQDFIDDLYPAWGCPEHWDGHMPYGNYLVFPYWLVAALQWATDSRDPMGSGHGYAQNIMGWAPFRQIEGGPTWEDIGAISKRVYGTEAALDPRSGYEDKAIPAIWHGHRTILKDSAPVCDNMFPRIFSLHTHDHFARADGMEGPDFEYHMIASATGLEMGKEDLDRVCERIFNLDRALLVRNWDRSRQDDETLIPYFEREEAWVNPVLGERKGMDGEKFLKLMDEYYELRGWDVRTGRPLRAKLEELGLKYVADDLEGRDLLPG